VSTLGVKPLPEVIQAITQMHERLRIVSPERIQAELTKLLVGSNVDRALMLVVETGLADVFLPELPALRLEQDPVHQHKDVFRHTLAVVKRCEPDVVLRLAALLHDIGKPKTREITPEGVQFHHHEVVGARMAEERLRALRYPERDIQDVKTLVELHLRFHTYGAGWSDGAVRRYVRDAGPLLDRLNQLTRADCTTQNPKKAAMFGQLQDELEERIARLAEQENLAAIRPPLDGHQVMEHLGIGPGPLVGEAREFLLEQRLERGPIEEDEAYRLLEEWARDKGIWPPEEGSATAGGPGGSWRRAMERRGVRPADPPERRDRLHRPCGRASTSQLPARPRRAARARAPHPAAAVSRSLGRSPGAPAGAGGEGGDVRRSGRTRSGAGPVGRQPRPVPAGGGGRGPGPGRDGSGPGDRPDGVPV
jgi:putative nucleotidyltransferase with HDIG domain